ncbi:MAG: hypothetical protein HKN91_03770 [Acidimicrobiia bacterium]|nr:hypothetical protein [Acidimicrobiia bacterium]
MATTTDRETKSLQTGARKQRKTPLIAMAAVVAIVATVAVAFAVSNQGADDQPIVRIFDSAGNATDGNEVLGNSELARSDNGLEATANVSGLTEGGIYTFWWVAIPAGGVFPDDAFVAGAGGEVVGESGEATANMTAESGQPSIDGFLIPFQPLDFDLATAEVHVEIAYHGLAADTADVNKALSDFWTGPACPDNGNNPGGFTTGDTPIVSNPGQPHCPVSIVAIHTP